MMFTMDVPTVPMHETPIVLAQAAAPSATATPQPDYILNDCQETESTGDPRSAMRAVDPGYMLANFLNGDPDKQVVFNLIDIKNITLLQGTTHGNLVAGTSTSGRAAYRYDPPADYVGNDKAVFMAEFKGKVYKIVVELKVKLIVNENNPTCPPPKLIKANKPVKRSSGASGFGAGYAPSSVAVTFAGFSGTAVSHRTP